MKFSKFYVDSLKEKRKKKNVSMFYNSKDELKAKKIMGKINPALEYISSTYNVKKSPKISIYLYPDLNEMNMAFGRTLPHDQCCFVPIKGDQSLVTFTSNIKIINIMQILIHEFSHIFFNKITGNQEIGKFRQTKPMWIDEGLALLLDLNFRKDIKTVLLNRIKLFEEGFSKMLPKLSDQYIYYNRLDDNVEFGPRGMLAYSFSFFCVLELAVKYGKENLFKFIKNTLDMKPFEKLFYNFFDITLDNFDFTMRCKMKEMSKFKNRSIQKTIQMTHLINNVPNTLVNELL